MIYIGKMAASMGVKVRYCPVCPACKPGFVFVFGRAKAIHNCTMKELKEWLQAHRTLEDGPLPLTGRKHDLAAVVIDSVERGVKHAGTQVRPKPSPSSSPSLPSSKSNEERPAPCTRQHASCSECSETMDFPVCGETESSLSRSRSWHDSDDEVDTYDTGRSTMPVRQVSRSSLPSSVSPVVMVTIYPFDARLPDELTLVPGDKVIVKDWNATAKWATGRKQSCPYYKIGYFYKSFVKKESEIWHPEPLKAVRSLPAGAATVSYGGREHILTCPPDDNLVCMVCEQVTTTQTPCCKHTLCGTCHKEWAARGNTCPNCRRRPFWIERNARAQVALQRLVAYCSNWTYGCSWSGGVSVAQDHAADRCSFETVKCPDNCGKWLPRRELGAHAVQECTRREVVCPCCLKNQKSVINTSPQAPVKSVPDGLWNMMKSAINWAFSTPLTYETLTTQHYKECPDWPARCPNGCSQSLTLTHSTIDNHCSKECPEAFVTCRFASVGCSVRVKRKALAAHEHDSSADHLALMMKEHLALRETVKELRDENGRLRSRVSTLEGEVQKWKGRRPTSAW